MNVKDYKEIIKKTAVFPQKVDNFGVSYLFLGLLGEIDEMSSSLNALYTFKGENQDELEKNVVKEVGDVFWYVTGLSNEMGLDVEKIFSLESCELPKNYSFNVMAENIKKFYRDGKELNKKVISDYLQCYIKAVMDNISKFKSDNLTMENIMKTNYDKLMKRRETNTIHGDGDNREEQ